MHGLLDGTKWVESLTQRLKTDGHEAGPEVLFLSDTVAIGMPIIKNRGRATPTVEEIDHEVHALALASALAGEIIYRGGSEPIPMAYRGSISFGDYEMDPPFIIGDAVNDAAEHYELADVAGVWLTPSALAIWRAGLDRTNPATAVAYHPYTVPLRSGGSFDSVVANIFHNNFAGKPERQQWIKSLLDTFQGPISVHIKRQHTARLLTVLEAAKDAYDSTNQVVGSGKREGRDLGQPHPDEPHGDDDRHGEH
jgi:hypothetical protein